MLVLPNFPNLPPFFSTLSLLNLLVLLYTIVLVYIHIYPSCPSLQYLDSSHTCLPPQDPSHTADCTLSRSAILPTLDRYTLAHLAGYFLKALLIPDPLLLHTASLLFELLELLLTPYIPSLAECWWDSLLLDLVFTNALGITLGTHLSHLLSTRFPFSFPFRPQAHPHFRLVILVSLLVTDLNAFLLKHNLRLRAESPLNLYRLLLFLLLATRAIPTLYKPHSTLPILPTLFLLLLLLELSISLPLI